MELAPVHETAMVAARIRAVHLSVDGEPKIIRDPFALTLLGLTEASVRDWWAEASSQLPTTAPWVLRSRYTEDRVSDAWARGVRQYVILGAGLDSFAYRNRSLADLRVFEVDDLSLQHWKRQRLADEGVPIPATCCFVPCDFEVERPEIALRRAGFVSSEAAVVSWLAVTQYLTRAAIAQILGWAARLADGSEIVLTYIVPGPEAEVGRKMWAERGVSFSRFFTPDEITGVLHSAGFRAVDHLDPRDANQLYFRNRTDGLTAPTVERLVVGVVG